jgi:hypothetical protein
VDRNLGWSLLFFGSSIVALVVAAATSAQKQDPTSLTLFFIAGALFLAAFWMLFRKRAFIIDQEAHVLSIIEQRIIGKSSYSYPLKMVTVTLEEKVLRPYRTRGGGRSDNTLIVGAIRISSHGKKEVLFLDDLRGPEEGKMVATQLAADLGCPLRIIERDDWTE